MKKDYLSLGGLFVALHVIFILLSRFLPGSSLLLVIFLPLLSALYSIKFDAKKVAMFSLAVFFLSLLFEPVSTFIYVVPALICGISYGELRKRNIKELSLVYLTTLSHSLSLFVSFMFIALLFKEVDFFSIFKSFINCEGSEFYLLVYLTLLTLGLIEAFITHFISDSELTKLGYKELKDEEKAPNWLIIGLLISLIVYTIAYFINPVYSAYALPFTFAFAIPIVVEFIMNNKSKWIYLLCGLIFFMNIFFINNISHLAMPILLVSIFSPIFLYKIFTVLYTFKINYLKNRENIIK